MSFSHHAPQHAVMLLLFWLVNFSELTNKLDVQLEFTFK